MTTSFNALLSTQIGNEFAASQQYIAVATWFANQDLPQLARYFYRQSVEERNHAMMMVQYMLDRDIEALFRAARGEDDALGEQFILWFLNEQVEEVASMTTLLNIAERADNLFDIENFIARETIGDGGRDSSAPAAAGGAL
jgi:ferritin